MVAVDNALDGKAVGYAIWSVPVKEGNEDELPQPSTTPSSMDPTALADLLQIMDKDEYDTFGVRGTKDVWSESLLYSKAPMDV